MSEVIGSIIHIGNTETVGSAGTFKKRLLVVKTDEQYAQEVPIVRIDKQLFLPNISFKTIDEAVELTKKFLV